MLVVLEVNLLALGEDFVLAVLFVPLSDGRILVHVLDDFAPADASVVSAEGNFTLLRGVRDDAHFCAAEIVVEKILEPHARKEKEIPRILAALHGVVQSAIGTDLTVNLFSLILATHAEGLVKLLPEILEAQTWRGLERMIVLQQSHGRHIRGKFLAARSICNFADVSDKAWNVQELRDRRPFLVFLVDHDRGTHAAIRVATAAHLSPHGIGAVCQVSEIGERTDQRYREPVASRFDSSDLLADVLGQVRQRVALAQAAFGSDFLVATCEGNRLKRNEGDFLRVFHGELHDGTDLVVVHVVDDGGDQNNVDTSCVHVFDGAQFYVEQVADLAVAVRVIANAVKLQVGVTQARFESLGAEILALGELDSVGSSLHAVVANFAGEANGVKEARVHGWLAAGKLYGHLAARLDLGSVLEDFLNLFPVQFVNIADLVGVHEARVAHHVATIGEVNGENRAAAVANGAGTVAVHVFVVVCRNVTAGEIIFNPFEELRIGGRQVFALAVDWAFFHHPNLAIAFDDLSFNLADLFVYQVGPIF